MYCRSCGKAAENGDLYCRECGGALDVGLEAPAAPPLPGRSRFCPTCGAPLEEADLYCRQCGRSLALEPAPGAARATGWRPAGVPAARAGSGTATPGARAQESINRWADGIDVKARAAWKKITDTVADPVARADFLSTFREPIAASLTAVITGLVLCLIVYAAASGPLRQALGGPSGAGALANPFALFAASHLLSLKARMALNFFGESMAATALARLGILTLAVVPFVGLLFGTAWQGPRARARTGLGGPAFAVRVACVYTLMLLLIVAVLNIVMKSALLRALGGALGGSGLGDLGLGGLGGQAGLGFSLGSVVVMGLLLGYFFTLAGWYLSHRRYWPMTAFAGGAKALLCAFAVLTVASTVVAALERSGVGAALLGSFNLGAYALMYLHGLPVRVTGAGTASLFGGWTGTLVKLAPGAWHYLFLIIPLAAMVWGGWVVENRRRRKAGAAGVAGGSLPPGAVGERPRGRVADCLAFGLGYGLFGGILAFASRITVGLGGDVDLVQEFLPGSVAGFGAGSSTAGAFLLLGLLASVLGFAGASLAAIQSGPRVPRAGARAREAARPPAAAEPPGDLQARAAGEPPVVGAGCPEGRPRRSGGRKRRCLAISLAALAVVLATAGGLAAFDVIPVRALFSSVPRSFVADISVAGPDGAYWVRQAADGGYVVTGSVGSGSSRAYRTLKTDASGTVVGSAVLAGTPQHTMGAEPCPDGSAIVFGAVDASALWSGGHEHDGWAGFYDPSGQELWSRSFGGSGNEYFRHGLPTRDGGFILVGYTCPYGSSDYDGLILKLDGRGETLWSGTAGSSGPDQFCSVVVLADGGYMAVGRRTDDSSSYGFLWVVKYDSDGDRLWERIHTGLLPSSLPWAQPTSDGGCVVMAAKTGSDASRGWLVKLDAEGREQWSVDLGDGDGVSGYEAREARDGSFFVCGGRAQGDRVGWLAKLSDEGVVLWSKDIPGVLLCSCEPTPDGGCAICGEKLAGGTADSWLGKVDRRGYVPAGETD